MKKNFRKFFVFLLCLWPGYYAKIIPDVDGKEKFLIRDGYVPQTQTHAKYVVALVQSNKFDENDESTFGKGFFCGGSIIGLRTILTAAHCVYKKQPDDIKVIAGTPIRTEKAPTTQVFDVTDINYHEEFKYEEYAHDIAVLHLDDEIIEDFKSAERLYIAPRSYAEPGVLCLLVGWGRHDLKSSLSKELQYVVLEIYDKPICQKWLPMKVETTICAGDPSGKMGGGCYGDSGGPLICRGRLTGVQSMIHTGKKASPTHFTNVNKYLDWIREKTIDKLTFQMRSKTMRSITMRSIAERKLANVIILKFSILLIFVVHM